MTGPRGHGSRGDDHAGEPAGTVPGTTAKPFYQTGPLQLWVLDGLLGPAAVRGITTSIARSAGPNGPEGGVFAQFEHQTRLLARRSDSP